MSDWEEENPEEVLYHSAPRSRYAHPIHKLQLSSNPSVLDERSNFVWLNWIRKPFKHFYVQTQNLFYFWIKPFKNLFFSSRLPTQKSMENWLNYYDNMYINQFPSPQRFKHLILKYHLPDWPLPYQENDELFYHFHPLGPIFADIDFLLTPLLEEIDNNQDLLSSWFDARCDEVQICKTPIEPDSSPVLRSPSSSEWGTVEDALSFRQELDIKNKAYARHQAKICWGLMVFYSTPSLRLLKETHLDNLSLISLDVLKNYPQELKSEFGISPDKYKKAALEKKFLVFPSIFS